MTAARPGARGAGGFALPAAALVLCAVQLAATLPGELNADSAEQLRQALTHDFADWHPPVMALVWSWLLDLTGKPGSLLVLQQGLHWLGFGLIADGLSRAGMPRRAWAVLAAGAFPLFLFYDRVLVKDVEMGAAYIAAFGLCVRFLLVRGAIPAWAAALAGVLLLYGTLVRTNAAFALGPIGCLIFVRGRRFGLGQVIAFAAIVVVAAVPLSNLVNHRLIGAKTQDAMQSLQLYDLVGIAVRSGDVAVLGAKEPPLAAVTRCYTAYWWDPFSVWGTCAALRRDMSVVSADDAVDPVVVGERAALWRQAILRHPFSYVAHRLSYFNSSVYWFVPALHFRYSKSKDLGVTDPQAVSRHDLRVDYLKKNVLFWPAFWLALGCCALGFLQLPVPSFLPMPSSLPVTFARLSIMSGLLYAGAYLLIGVATDVRYYYWPIMAILVGGLLALPDLRAQCRASPKAAKLALAVLLAIIVAGYAARLADVPFI